MTIADLDLAVSGTAPTPVVVAGPISTDLARRLGAISEAHPGVVCATPGRWRRLVEVADAVLDGLGKGTAVGGGRSSSASVIAQATAWLVVRGITDVLVKDAELSTAPLAAQAGRWLLAHGVRPWFIIDSAGGPTEPSAQERLGTLAAEFGVETVSVEELGRRFPGLESATIRRERAPSDPEPFPRVPRCDGLVFRSSAKALLSEADFAVVDARLLEVVRTTREFCAANRQASADRICGFWRSQIEPCVTVDELLTVTRGVQVGAFTDEWLISVDTSRLVAAAAVEPRAGVRTAQRWWEQFNQYRTTSPGALAVLYSADLALEDIERLRLADITCDSETGVVGVASPEGTTLTLDGDEAALVQAHLVYRQQTGGTDSDHLFTGFRGQPLRDRSLGDALQGPVTEIGVTVASPPVRRRRPTEAQRAARYGVRAARGKRSRR